MGDTFDSRKGVDFVSLEWAKNHYYDRLAELGITVHTIIGNHTAYYKDTNEINTVELLLKEYDNVEVYSEPTTVNIGGLDILMLPWINEENKLQTLEMMKDVFGVLLHH